MKIELDNYNCCTSVNCAFRKTCAQHSSAGDFRSEGGFSPEITPELECLTANEPPIQEFYDCFPKNRDSLGMGFRSDPITRTDNTTSSDHLTQADISLLKSVASHLYLLSDTVRLPKARPCWEYGMKLDKLIAKLENILESP